MLSTDLAATGAAAAAAVASLVASSAADSDLQAPHAPKTAVEQLQWFFC
jgi:hypothetical protein